MTRTNDNPTREGNDPRRTSKEIWKTIPGFPDYSASTFGKIRREIGKQGVRAGRVLVGRQKDGYLETKLKRKGKRITILIHRIVALTFLGKRPHKLVTMHRNSKKTDNRIKNLLYTTQKINVKVDRKRETHKRSFRWMTINVVRVVRKMLEAGVPRSIVRTKFGLSKYQVGSLAIGKTRYKENDHGSWWVPSRRKAI